MALPNARNQYLKTQIETASKEQLVVMLFDGIIRFTEQARKALAESQVEDTHHALMRAQAIIMELICTVDKEKGGDVANNLLSLHAYAFNCLIICNMKKDVTQIDEVQKIYRELRDAWTGAMDNLGISSNAGKPLATPPPAPAGKTGTTLGVSSGIGRPASGSHNTSVRAAAPAAPVAAKPAASAPAAPATGLGAPIKAATIPAASKPVGYGLGRTSAMFGSAPAAAAPAAAVGVTPAKTVASSMIKPAGMLNAYNAARNIA